MEGEALRRGLECDCGYVAYGEDDDELVASVQAHARESHGMRLPAELILTLASSNGAPFQYVNDPLPQDAAVSPEGRGLRR